MQIEITTTSKHPSRPVAPERMVSAAPNPDLVCCRADAVVRGRREFWTLPLIRRDFSGLTLTSGKP